MVWNRRESPVTEGLFGGVFANGTFVLAGTGGQIVYSTNAVAWQRATTAASESLNLQALAYGNGAFLASGAWGYVFQSRQGENFNFSMHAAALEFPETPFGAKSVLPVLIANTGTLPIIGWNFGGKGGTPPPSFL